MRVVSSATGHHQTSQMKIAGDLIKANVQTELPANISTDAMNVVNLGMGLTSAENVNKIVKIRQAHPHQHKKWENKMNIFQGL